MTDQAIPEDGDSDEHAAVQRLAHDLLQSIAIIQAVTATIRREVPDDSSAPDRLALIERETQTMMSMCEQQLRRDLQVTPMDISEIIARVTDRISLSGPTSIDVDAEPCALLGDPVAWERALFNLIENGCRAAGSDGKVEIVVRQRDGSISIKVGDSGPGFGQAQSGRASLGLVSVAELVDGHGGHIELRRSPLGGAELTIMVPG